MTDCDSPEPPTAEDADDETAIPPGRPMARGSRNDDARATRSPRADADDRSSGGVDGVPALDRLGADVAALPDGVFVLDERGTVEYVNDAAAALLDVEPATLTGRDARTLVSDGPLEWSLVEWYGESVRRLLSSETDAETARTETPVHVDDGPRTVEIALSLRPVDRPFEGTVGTIRDVTDRRARTDRLERERDRLDEFVDVAAHDLRNPLTVARGRLELARESRDADDLAAVEGALDRMDELLEDLTRLAREGDSTTGRRPVDLAAVARQSWQTVATGEATLRTPSERRLGATPSRLRQLLENLCSNAVEHGGEAVTVTVGDLADGFFVEDDGPGIPAPQRDRIFESGYSAGADGSGLGLAIVADIAAAHGWSLRATEGRDGGARFEFTDVDPAESR